MIMAPEENGPRIAPIAVLLILLSIGLAGSLDQLHNDSIGNDIKIANWAQFFGVITGGVLAAALPKHPEVDLDTNLEEQGLQG